jgi:16S rRNA (uracil1498-N3)-methyltransferase
MTFLKWMTAALLLIALPTMAAAQSDSGRISGTVLDQTGAYAAGATVTLRNAKTGETRTAATNDKGYFVVSPLKPSTYTITVQKTGFAVIEYTDMPLAVGQELTLFNGAGGEFAARIESFTGSTATVSVGAERAVERESPLTLRLAQGVSRAERMDLVMQKATELGVTHLIPVLTERSVVRLDASQSARKLSHWRAITIAACEQSGRNRPPGVLGPVPLADFLRSDLKSGTRLLLSPAAQLRIVDVPRPAHSVTVLIGPEGGLTQAEQERALAAGFVGVRLGPRVLRTETAAIAALTLLQREFGDL